MGLYEDVAIFVDQHRSDIIASCSALIQCATENPPGDTTAAAAMIENQLAGWGLASKRLGPREDAPNLVATIDGNGPGPHLVYNGHMDVFPVGDPGLWTHGPLNGTVAEGRIYGRGAADMKSGLTASLWAFGALASHRQRWQGRVTLTAVSEEETFGPAGARYLVENHGADVLGDAMISGEPSSMRLIYGGSRGLIWLQVRVEAEGGHSTKPHLGRSAIKEMRTLLDHLEHEIETLPVNVAPEIRDVVEAAKPVTDDLAGDGATDGLLRITTNVGTVTGGLAVNMLAESCEARVDIRFLPGVEIEQLLDTVTRVVSEHRGASFEVIRQTAACFGDPSATIYRAIAKATADVSGTAAALTLSHATGDNRLWLYAGVPTAMLGPTAIRVGSANEYVEIDDLLSVTKVHAMAATAYLTGAAGAP